VDITFNTFYKCTAAFRKQFICKLITQICSRGEGKVAVYLKKKSGGSCGGGDGGGGGGGGGGDGGSSSSSSSSIVVVRNKKGCLCPFHRPSGIEPATFLFVAQCLSQLRHPVPSLQNNV
jgi:hypothetical protein